MRKLILAVLCLCALASTVKAQTLHDPWGAVVAPTNNCPVPQSQNFTVNTTSNTAVTTTGTTTVITPVSMTGISTGMFLLADPCQQPVQVTNEVVAAGNGATTSFSFTLARDTYVPGTIAITATTASGTVTVTEDSPFNAQYVGHGLTGSGGGGITCTTAVPCGIFTLFNKSGSGDSTGNDSEWVTVKFAVAPTNGTNITATYQYLPSEVCQVSATTGSTFTCNFRNTHSSGFKIWPGYPMTGKITDGSTGKSRWVYVSPLSGFPGWLRGMWQPGQADVHHFTGGGLVLTPSSVNTTLSASCASGQPTCTPVSMTNIVANANQVLRLGDTSFSCRVQSVTGSTFTCTANLTSTLGSGTAVQCCVQVDIWNARYGNADLTALPAEAARMTQRGWNAMTAAGSQYIYPDKKFDNGFVPQTPDHYAPVKVPYTSETRMETYTGWNWLGFMNTSTTGSNGVKDLNYAQNPNYGSTFFTDTYKGSEHVDAFDPRIQQYWAGELAAEVAPVQSPWFVARKPAETDGFAWLGAGEDFPTISSGHNQLHGGVEVFISAPIICGDPAGKHDTRYTQAYADCTNFTKAQLATNLQTEYTTIGALNTAYGSGYTTFGSSGTQVTGESLATADGSTTVFTKTTASTLIDRFTVQVIATPPGLSGTAIAGSTDTDTVLGPNNSESSAHENINTTVAGAISAGTQTVSPASMAGIYPGTALRIDSGGGADEFVYVSSVGLGNTCSGVSGGSSNCTPANFTATFANAHSAAFTVTRAFNCTTGSINRSTGAFSVTCSPAIKNGVVLTLNYHHHGWGQGGTGLLDEDGTSTYLGASTHSIVYVNQSTLNGKGGLVNAAFQADMNAWLQTEYDKVMGDFYNGMRTSAPHALAMTMYSVGAWNTPGRPEVYKHVASGNPNTPSGKSADVQSWSGLTAYASNSTSTRNGGPALKRYPYLLHYLGDAPVISWDGDDANADSAAFFCGAGGNATQTLRASVFDTSFNHQSTDAHPDLNLINGIGIEVWAHPDFTNGECTNWGMEDVSGNWYGTETNTTSGRTYSALGVSYGIIPEKADWSDGDFGGTLTTRFATIDNLLSNGTAAPAVLLTPTNHTFAAQTVGTPSGAFTFVLQNSGTATLNITSITPTGDYSYTTDCGSTLAASASCNIFVTFTPTAVGTRNGTVSVVTNASTSPDSVTVTGTGVASTGTITGIGTVGGTVTIKVNP